ncbi:class I SAM-dependent methyltransferase, partial [uncultured Roseovarius sp.]|uniref:class I SAM-dependent rRNA methyltransferase n=1 Tax=uncultured Roseovarius sp. TaxID=293344 RepID=UPI0026044BDB
MTPSPYPVIRLRPNVQPRAIRHGAPWVYDNEIVTDRRTRALEPGTIAQLEDAERAPLGLVAFNPASRIMARMMERDCAARIDRDWLQGRIERAHAMRARFYDSPHYRLVHAEADGLPGVVIDRFDDIAVIQPNAAWAERMLPDLVAAVQEITGVKTVLKNAGGRARNLEGLDDVSAVLAGDAPQSALPVPMNNAIYMADLMGGQKTGLFYDQRPNHAFAARLSRDLRVLDVFSHVGGFSLAALAAGAASAHAVDGSEPALALAAEGAA